MAYILQYKELEYSYSCLFIENTDYNMPLEIDLGHS